MSECYKTNYATLETCKQVLEKDGYCVIPVLNDNEITELRENAWEALNYITQNLEKPIRKDDPSTWTSFWELYPLRSMMLKHFIGHSQFMWNIRQHSKIKEVFSTLHNDSNLLTSYDGFSIHFPFEKLPRHRGKGRNNPWFHTDQSPHRKETCIQGIVNLYDINEGDSTLRVIEGSHTKHAQFFQEKGVHKVTGDWYKPCDKELKFFDGLEKIHVKAKAGDIILWDSKTFHCGGEAYGWRQKPNFRLAAYVCMLPRKMYGKSVITC